MDPIGDSVLAEMERSPVDWAGPVTDRLHVSQRIGRSPYCFGQKRPVADTDRRLPTSREIYYSNAHAILLLSIEMLV